MRQYKIVGLYNSCREIPLYTILEIDIYVYNNIYTAFGSKPKKPSFSDLSNPVSLYMYS